MLGQSSIFAAGLLLLLFYYATQSATITRDLVMGFGILLLGIKFPYLLCGAAILIFARRFKALMLGLTFLLVAMTFVSARWGIGILWEHLAALRAYSGAAFEGPYKFWSLDFIDCTFIRVFAPFLGIRLAQGLASALSALLIWVCLASLRAFGVEVNSHARALRGLIYIMAVYLLFSPYIGHFEEFLVIVPVTLLMVESQKLFHWVAYSKCWLSLAFCFQVYTVLPSLGYNLVAWLLKCVLFGSILLLDRKLMQYAAPKTSD